MASEKKLTRWVWKRLEVAGRSDGVREFIASVEPHARTVLPRPDDFLQAIPAFAVVGAVLENAERVGGGDPSQAWQLRQQRGQLAAAMRASANGLHRNVRRFADQTVTEMEKAF